MSPQQRQVRDERYEVMVVRLYELAGVEGLDYDTMRAIIEARCQATGRPMWKEVEVAHRRLADALVFA